MLIVVKPELGEVKNLQVRLSLYILLIKKVGTEQRSAHPPRIETIYDIFSLLQAFYAFFCANHLQFIMSLPLQHGNKKIVDNQQKNQ